MAKRDELHTFVVLPKRWIVERSFAWLERCRRLWKNWERKLNTSSQFVQLAFLALLFKRSRTDSKVYTETWPPSISVSGRILPESHGAQWPVAEMSMLRMRKARMLTEWALRKLSYWVRHP